MSCMQYVCYFIFIINKTQHDVSFVVFQCLNVLINKIVKDKTSFDKVKISQNTV